MLHFTSLPWHDAEVHCFNVSWSANGIAQVVLKIEINPEESLQPFIEMGINSPIMDICFKQIWRLKSDLRGDSCPKELLLDWHIIQPSPFVTEIKNQGMAQDIPLYHQQLQFSGGSVIDLVFEEVCLTQIPT